MRFCLPPEIRNMKSHFLMTFNEKRLTHQLFIIILFIAKSTQRFITLPFFHNDREKCILCDFPGRFFQNSFLCWPLPWKRMPPSNVITIY